MFIQSKFIAADPTENQLSDETVFTGTAEVVNSVEDKKPQNHSPFYMTT